MHRDIKPENLVFDSHGYLRITDFGIAKHYVVNNKKDTSGTIGYLAPEVLCNENHTFSIDYYAVGIITYELMYGHRPYLGKSKHEVKHLILTRQAQIDYDELPDGFANEAADFVNKLIQRKPKNRLGRDSIAEVLNHPWFDDFDWEQVKRKKLKAPYVPKAGDNFDRKYCLAANKVGTETMERYKEIMAEPNLDNIFKGFVCNKIPEELKGINLKQKSESSNANNQSSNTINSTTISRNNRGNDTNKQNFNKGSSNLHNNINLIENKSLTNFLSNKNTTKNSQMFMINKDKVINNILKNDSVDLSNKKNSGEKQNSLINTQNKHLINSNSSVNFNQTLKCPSNPCLINTNLNQNLNSTINYKPQDILYATRRHNKLFGTINNMSKINSYNNLNNSQMNDSSYYHSIKNSFNSYNNSIMKRSSSMNKGKKESLKKDILNGTYYSGKQSKLYMGATSYKRYKPNSNNTGVISGGKRLASSHSMQNLKQSQIQPSKNPHSLFGSPTMNLINNINSINNSSIKPMMKEPNLGSVSSISKNKGNLIYDKKLPFINISLTKKRGTVLGNEIYFAAYGKNGQSNFNGLTERFKNNKQKLRNTLNNSLNKSQFISKRKGSPGQGNNGNLSYFM